MTEGVTYIKPKNNETQNPANYRPITCLPTLYKIITAVICQKINQHLSQHNILTEEQKGCREQSQGCKEQLTIDAVVMGQAVKECRNLHVTYIDYKKAYDSIPHSWLKKVLQIYKIHPMLQNFLSQTMQSWRTSIHLTTCNANIQTDTIPIKRGIFQGDSLSALWFCICLNPLSNTLNETAYGFNIKYEKSVRHKINHLLYMDDIKLYTATKTEHTELLKILEKSTNDIKMEFGMNKCKTLHINRGKWQNEEQASTLNNEHLDNMQPNEYYKYLGILQNRKVDHTALKTQLKEQYRKRLSKILKTELNSKNTVRAINTYAIPLLTYSFGIIKWSKTDLENLNILTRTQLTRFRQLHPNSCKERLTIERKEGGRGLTDIHEIHNKQINSLRKYFKEKNTSLHQAVTIADANYTPLNLNAENIPVSNILTLEEKKNKWSQKQLHGKHCHIMNNPDIDKELSYSLLQKGQLQPETEGFIIAIQDQVIATRNYRKYIIKDRAQQTDTCRRCHLQSETIEHITNGCKILTGTEYTLRHDFVARIIHQEIAKTYKFIQEEQPYYKYTPQSVFENDTIKLYWDRTIHTDKTVTCNRPDITLTLKKEKVTYLIEISVPNDNNITKKYEEKISKYIPLTQEVERIWQQKEVKILPFIISSTGLTHRKFKENLDILNLKGHIHTLAQKAVIIKTTNITRSFLKQ